MSLRQPPHGARFVLRLLAVLLFGLGLISPAAYSAEPESDLRFVLILSRHGVRAPLANQNENAVYAAQAWPKWSSPPSYLTPHGVKQMELMGAYYRERYIQEGLLSGQVAADAPLIYFRANNEQRTLGTATALASTLLPGVTPTIVARPAGETDPLFRSTKVPLGHVDHELGVASLLGSVGGDLRRVEESHLPEFATLNKILMGESGVVPPGKKSLLSLPTSVTPGSGENVTTVTGPLAKAGSITDAFMLQFSEGLPMSEVGWGRITPERLTQLLTLHALWLDLQHGSFYAAQAEGSNLASHIGDTLTQAATGQRVVGAFGQPGQKMVVIAGHETNQVRFAGLLGLNWALPGLQHNPVLLGGALVFELRERRSDHQYFVRLQYVSPSLAQTRALTPLSLENPPATAPIFIHGCSTAAPGYDAPLAAFEAKLAQVIDPQFVAPSAE